MNSDVVLQYAALLENFSRGGTEAEVAARQLFNLLWRKFVASFVRSGQPLAIAEELASDAFSKILRQLHTMREPVAFQKWAHTVARNTLLSYLRANKAEVESVQAIDQETHDTLLANLVHPDTADLVTMLCLKRQLETFCRDCPERSYWLECWILDDYPLAEMAMRMERTLAAAKEYLSQCRKRLQDYLKQCLD